MWGDRAGIVESDVWWDTSPTQEPAASSRDASGWSEWAPTPRPPMQLEGRSRVALGPSKGLWQLGKGTAI